MKYISMTIKCKFSTDSQNNELDKRQRRHRVKKV